MKVEAEAEMEELDSVLQPFEGEETGDFDPVMWDIENPHAVPEQQLLLSSHHPPVSAVPSTCSFAPSTSVAAYSL